MQHVKNSKEKRKQAEKDGKSEKGAADGSHTCEVGGVKENDSDHV